jgi:hypothetical protein
MRTTRVHIADLGIMTLLRSRRAAFTLFCAKLWSIHRHRVPMRGPSLAYECMPLSQGSDAKRWLVDPNRHGIFSLRSGKGPGMDVVRLHHRATRGKSAATKGATGDAAPPPTPRVASGAAVPAVAPHVASAQVREAINAGEPYSGVVTFVAKERDFCVVGGGTLLRPDALSAADLRGRCGGHVDAHAPVTLPPEIHLGCKISGKRVTNTGPGSSMRRQSHMHMNVHVHVHVHVCVAHMCVWMRKCVCMCARMRMCMCMRMCIPTRTEGDAHPSILVTSTRPFSRGAVGGC